MKFPYQVRIEDPSQSGEARRNALSLCRSLNFNEILSNQVAIVVTELATNLIKHTSGAGGMLIFSPIEENGEFGLDILALDHGAGIANIAECLQDGYSTTGTPGGGLGAIRRLSSVSDIYSMPNQGSGLFCRFWQKQHFESTRLLEVGAVCLTIKGEESCGDAWATKSNSNSTVIMLVDGLGHGPDAAVAANQAITIFRQSTTHNPKEILPLLQTGLNHTRGAAIAIAKIAFADNRVSFVGIGNISAIIFDQERSNHLVSHNGIVGLNAHNFKEFSYPWTQNSLLVLHSDGVATHWSLANYPGLTAKHPALIAGVLFRDYERIHDDSTIVIAKAPQEYAL
jgi:anti-sigma regulatory factor (Ser/Thr protein kinase)